MQDTQGGLSALIRRGPYARQGTTAARYAARLYQPIISGITLLLLAITIWQYREAPRVVTVTLFAGMVAYTVYSLLRLATSPRLDDLWRHPSAQFLRCQSGILVVSLLIGILTAHGLSNHEVWLLYVLALLILSERLSTKILLATLIEVGFLLILVSYIGARLFTGAAFSVLTFISTSPYLLAHVLWIWLITFILHYLIRNIQARDEAFSQHKYWLKMIQEAALATGRPETQYNALVESARTLMNCHVTLWIPRPTDGKLTNSDGIVAGPRIETAATSVEPSIALRQPTMPVRVSKVLKWLCKNLPGTTLRRLCNDLQMRGRRSVIGLLRVLEEPPDQAAVATQILLPIYRLHSDKSLLVVFEFAYPKQPSLFQLEIGSTRLMDFAEHARLILMAARQGEIRRLMTEILWPPQPFRDQQEIAQRIADDMVDKFGFDFATVSLVDNAANIIRAIAGRNADWLPEANYRLGGDDVHNLVIKTGQVFCDHGEQALLLDHRITRHYRLQNTSRAWIPIMSSGGATPGIGTIHIGFLRCDTSAFGKERIAVLMEYAYHAHSALVATQREQRQRELTDALAKLHESRSRFPQINALMELQDRGQDIQRLVSLYDPHQVAALVGRSAQEIVRANIVIVYLWDEDHLSLEIAYITDQAIEGRGQLVVDLREGSLLHRLSTQRTAYFSPDAQDDPLLVNFGPDGRANGAHRTFSQRQNVRSFVGLPLVGRDPRGVGFLCLNYRSRREFHLEERRILEVFARQAAMTLEEARSQRTLQALTIAQERASFAADVHHSLSQQLFGLDLQIRTAARLLDRGEGESAKTSLKKATVESEKSLKALGRLLKETYYDQEPQADLVASLGEAIPGLRTEYNVDIEFQHAVERAVPPQVQFYLSRIALEALHNAVRHGRGAPVCVVYQVKQSGYISLFVTDQGPGFEMAAVQRTPAHGLAAMRQYAAQLGGELRISAKPGEGTQVSLEVHLPSYGSNSHDEAN